ncbi:transcriptional regulator [Pseudomonas gingeri NCPPB 3146 = LMG 5327]|uniref:Helix-turn-helix transcriptional regulator n=2 Tax=Pseudomonas gingeri TaxID=117681 RepID=A0A7Y8CD36_9PSED|nr:MULTISPECIES: helix-turn-helix domain-containing protein [Pseudomonas]NVZ24365.1 helix-turn-helix transcriptional regulator [Pseudomonas gingeri]NVZ64326.1 helix-turn-helix transcriptional regulator [Pseudomonas gingeri]NVZ79545.1 helix-turn-helix transcriptional regulator [Pseudomonas gingeri]NWA11347.1 helix-turn-helix transcriptional regulator [Pseudomonas gingeri]NWC13571.1 helix-turn-helix transcriptional regulator [Pseudomonas gingeri]
MKRASFHPMPCPVARALEQLGDGWSLLILRDAFYGLRRFDDFLNSLGIATNTLTRRLNDLVLGGLLERRPYQDKPPRYEYHLTEAGRDLRPVILTLMAWGAKHAKGSRRVYLADEATGQPVDLALMDANTGKRITREGHRVHVTADADELSQWRVRTGQAQPLDDTLVSPFPN